MVTWWDLGGLLDGSERVMTWDVCAAAEEGGRAKKKRRTRPEAGS